MWLIVQLLMIGVSLLLIIKAVRQTEYLPLIFVILAVWMRFVLSSLHQFTYPPIAAGFSINALSSIAVALGGVLLAKKVFIANRSFIPLYLFIGVMVISGVLNHELKGLITNLVKWLYFLSLTVLLCDAFLKEGKDKSLYLLSCTFFLPIALQLASIALGQGKATENDGSVSFIGGYNHEAAFSMILVAYIYVITFIDGSYSRFTFLKIFIAVFGLILANYRTSMIAVLPMVAMYFWLKPASRLSKKDKLLAVTIMAFVVLGVFILISGQLAERFADIGKVIAAGDKLLINPNYYSEEYKDFFSARIYIWSQYIYAYYQGSFAQYVIGFGAESWSGKFLVYAHNTFVSILYEMGFLGVLLILIFILNLIKNSLIYANGISKILLVSALIGFMLLNLATMPFWNIEGLIVFSVLVSLVFYTKIDKLLNKYSRKQA